MYWNSCVGCGCHDCQCFISLLVSVVAVLAAVLWRWWDLAVNLKVGISFQIETQWVVVGSVLSLTRSSVSSEIRAVHAGHHIVLWVQLPLISILFIPLTFSISAGYLRAPLLPLSFRVALLLADLAGSSLLVEKSIILWDSNAGNLLHLVYTLSRLSEFKGNR